MKLTPPKQIVFFISVIIAVVALVLFFLGNLQFAAISALIAYILLACGNAVKGF